MNGHQTGAASKRWARAALVGGPALLAGVLPPGVAPPRTCPSSNASPRPGRPGRSRRPRPCQSSLRLHGLVEAVDFYSVMVPRVTGSGPGQNRLTIVRLAAKGTLVRKGDLLVEFDRQLQLRAALDKRAEWLDLEEQIQRSGPNSARSGPRTRPASSRPRTPCRWRGSR